MVQLLFRAKYLLPAEKWDEPELAPISTEQIVLPIIFLCGGLFFGLLSFLLEKWGQGFLKRGTGSDSDTGSDTGTDHTGSGSDTGTDMAVTSHEAWSDIPRIVNKASS